MFVEASAWASHVLCSPSPTPSLPHSHAGCVLPPPCPHGLQTSPASHRFAALSASVGSALRFASDCLFSTKPNNRTCEVAPQICSSGLFRWGSHCHLFRHTMVFCCCCCCCVCVCFRGVGQMATFKEKVLNQAREREREREREKNQQQQ